MKERQGRRVIFPIKQDFRDTICGRARKFALRVIIQDTLETGARRGGAAEGAITLAHIEIGVGAIGRARIEAEEFLIFGHRQIVELAAKESVGVVELALLRGLTLFCNRRGFRRIMRRVFFGR